ncbi:RhoGAP domain-containing protein [Cavenderia fasciculata]|uniref:RhoGAP domain-containing protein n=1 Tax=Cavenderia fasciculata TaxID=261658 RepID=F4Q0S2_CACFS|nr:RhoGAP domain-containing protein [Cavenderia fasciculata]EGG18423.1 RhoGAP domain-containing protein [Cavenderia fasciculata]|eukprot:XP_004366327.1 RhoGAP domain-containing protein [Cavenderia fasciculata]
MTSTLTAGGLPNDHILDPSSIYPISSSGNNVILNDQDDESSNNNSTQRPLSFGRDMWEGFETLCKRTEVGLDQCKELLEFFKKRVAIEEKLSKNQISKFKLKDETDSFQRGFTCISMLSDAEANIHKSFSQNLLNNLCHPFTAFVKELESRRKKLVNDGQKLRNDYKDSLDAVRKGHQKYERLCRDIESAKMELISMIEKEGEQDGVGPSLKIQTIEKKVAKCESLALIAEQEYKDQIKETNEFIYGNYQSKMADNLNEFEQFELMRMQFIKSNIKNYMALMMEIPSSLEAELNNGCKQTDWIDPDLDLNTFIKTHQSQKKLPLPFQFEPYLESKIISLNQSNHIPQSPSPPTRSLKDNIIGFFNKSTAALARSIDDTNQLSISSNNISSPPILTPGAPSSPSKASIFGSDLEELMDAQKKQFPNETVPLILNSFIQTLLRLGALETEGIFRISPVHHSIQIEKQKLDQGGNLDHIDDPYLAATLFKHWLRDLPNPLISSAIYDEIIESPENSWKIIKNGIPLLHQKVLNYVIDFLVEFIEPEFIAKTKMDAHSLAIVVTPVFIRSNLSNPQQALENSKKEIKVIECMLVESFNNKKRRLARSTEDVEDNGQQEEEKENDQSSETLNNDNSNNNDGDDNQQLSSQQEQQQQSLSQTNQQPSRNHSTLSFATMTSDATNSDVVLVEGSSEDMISVTTSSSGEEIHEDEFTVVSPTSGQPTNKDRSIRNSNSST